MGGSPGQGCCGAVGAVLPRRLVPGGGGLPGALPAPHKPHQASSYKIEQWVQGEAKQKIHLNTRMNLLLIFIIFIGSCKTFKNPLFMLFMTFFANLILWDVVLHFILVSNHRKL